MYFNFKFISFLLNLKLLGILLLFDITGIFPFIDKYVFADLNYLKFLAVAVIVDFITGICKVAMTEGVRSITSKGMRIGTVTKLISYACFLIGIHIATHVEVGGKQITNIDWIGKYALEFLIMVEVKSIYENLVKINPKLDFIDTVLQTVLNKFKTKKSEDVAIK